MSLLQIRLTLLEFLPQSVDVNSWKFSKLICVQNHENNKKPSIHVFCVCVCVSDDEEEEEEDEDEMKDQSLPRGTVWLDVESSREAAQWLPWRPDKAKGQTEEDCEDPDRQVRTARHTDRKGWI